MMLSNAIAATIPSCFSEASTDLVPNKITNTAKTSAMYTVLSFHKGNPCCGTVSNKMSSPLLMALI